MLTVRIIELISFCIQAHAEKPLEPKNAVRRWDNKTPYGIHPVWCAMTILAETTLTETIRHLGAEVLLLHDIDEDTSASLPEDCSCTVRTFVQEMTFADSEEEMRLVWSRSIMTQLFKLYDKVSNLLDGVWMPREKRERYEKYTLKLAQVVEKHFGTLNIVRMARAICK